MSPTTNLDETSKADSAVRHFFDQYVGRIPFYEKLVLAFESKCHLSLAEDEICHFTESRVKDHQSLWKKLDQRKGDACYSSVEDIENDIVDICGVRIIFHYTTDQHKIKALLEDILHIQEVKLHSGGREPAQNQLSDRWGYQLPLPDYIGTHYRGFVKSKIFEQELKDLSSTDRLRAATTMIEVQVRSIMDDIWARYAHRIYKSDEPSRKRQQSMLRNLRLALESVREATIEMEKLAAREEEKRNRKFETNDEVGNCFRKLIRVHYRRDFIDHTGVASEALKYFLESIGKNTPGSLQKLIKSEDLSDGPKSDYEEVKRLYGPIEFNVVLYLIDRVLLSEIGEDDTALKKQAVPPKEKVAILMSTILWLSRLFHSAYVWKIKLFSTPRQKSPRRGLYWLAETRQCNMLTKGRDFNSTDMAILDELWTLFENYDQRPIKLAFAMSSRGMIRDVVRERQELNAVIEELLAAPNFRS